MFAGGQDGAAERNGLRGNGNERQRRHDARNSNWAAAVRKGRGAGQKTENGRTME